MNRFRAALIAFCLVVPAGCDVHVNGHFGHGHGHGHEDDIHEQNDSSATASLLATGLMVGDGLVVTNLAGFDQDWFEIRTSEKSDLTVRIDQDSFFGDMDLFVYDGGGALLGSSTTDSDVDSVTVVGAAVGTYFILAAPFFTQPDYDLRIDLAVSSVKPRPRPALEEFDDSPK